MGSPDIYSLIYQYIVGFILDWSPFWLPIALAYTFWQVYFYYIKRNFIYSQVKDSVLLEVKMPREISKSPKAMEVVLARMHATSDGSLIDKYIKGKVRQWSALEIESRGGELHFYVWTKKGTKNLIEAQIYSQYPEVEVYEAEDYTKNIPFGHPDSPWQMFGMEFKLTKEDPYPIKTYVDYELDKDPKEEFKVDPMASLLEFMGSIGPNERLWVQIVIRATTDRFTNDKGEKVGWKDEAKKIIKKMIDAKKDKENPYSVGEFALTQGERETIKAIERSVGKMGFDAGIRMMYLGKGDSFAGYNIPGMISAFKQFNHEHLNGFKPTMFTSFDYPWQDFMGMRVAKRKRDMFFHYSIRSFFYPPCSRQPYVLNTEELATIFHFPGSTAATPSLSRIQSKRGEPPTNLPI